MADINSEILKYMHGEMVSLMDRIKINIAKSGQSASGRTANSLEVTDTNTSVSLMGKEFFSVIETGRKPGKRPPARNIMQWIGDRGIGGKSISEAIDQTFNIAKSIGEKGTILYQIGGRKDIYSNEIDKLINEIPDKLGDNIIIKLGDYVSSK